MKRFIVYRNMGNHRFRLLWWKLSIFTFTFSAAHSGFAVPANPDPYIELQPDGTEVVLRLKGDEWFNYQQDHKGYTVIRDRGWLVYAKQDEATGRLVSSGLRAGVDNPAANGIQPGELPTHAVRAALGKARGLPFIDPCTSSDGGSTTAPLAAPATGGILKNLVVMIRWADHTTRSVPAVADVDILMNAVGGDPVLAPTGSVRDVYLENSYGALSLESTVAAWVTSDGTETYYAAGNSGLTSLIHNAIRDALNKVDAFIDFSEFDADNDGKIDSITFLHSGYGAEWGGTDAYGTPYVNRIWSHKWSISGGWTSQEGVRVTDYHISPAVWGTSGSNIGRIGVIAHETGHFLGLPDLYDTDSSAGQGIGSFGLMANSWGFDGSQKYPPHMCPWSKVQMGWMNPTVIDSSGQYTINQTESSAEVYRIDQGYPSGEYLLVENRQPAGFDGAMPQGGLVIYHIDEAAGYNTEGYPTAQGWSGSHYKIAVLQADGTYDLERGYDRGDRYDPWHAAGNNELTVSVDPNSGPFPNTDAYQGNVFVQTNNRIYNISSSGPVMTFNYELIGTPVDPPAAPYSLAATPASYDAMELSWIDNSDNESGFKIERSLNGLSWTIITTVATDVTAFMDTNLSPSTVYYYRVRASNIAGDSAYSNTVSATTNPPPPPPAAPGGLEAAAVSDATINLTWLDNSPDEDEFVVRRSVDGSTWLDVATLAADSASHSDNGLSGSTTYAYQIVARNAWGESGSNIVQATTLAPPPFVYTYASMDVPVSGTVTGTYQLTEISDGNLQTITEIESGGKPTLRRSYLEHQWFFPNVRGGLEITLVVDAWAPDNSEGDDFIFEVSTNGGSNWNPMLTVPRNSAEGTFYTAILPTNSAGDYYVRVVDSDSTKGNRSLDPVHVDAIFLRTDLDPTDTEPAAPGNLEVVAVTSTSVELLWEDNSDNERGFRILRSANGSTYETVATAAIDATSYLDISVSPATAYYYKVEAYTASYSSASDTVGPVTTPDGLSLSAAGSRVKGKMVCNLAWAGGSSLDSVLIKRKIDDGQWEDIGTVANNSGGTYVDETGMKAGPVLQYLVQDALGNVVSNVVTVVF